MCKYCFECFCNDYDVIQFEKFVQSNIYMYQYLNLSSSWGLQVSKKHILTESYEDLTNFAGQRMNDLYMYNMPPVYSGHAFCIPQVRNVWFRTCLESPLGGLIIDRFDCDSKPVYNLRLRTERWSLNIHSCKFLFDDILPVFASHPHLPLDKCIIVLKLVQSSFSQNAITTTQL